MNLRTARALAQTGAGRVRLTGGVVLLALVVLTALSAPWTPRMQAAWWDVHQAAWPRQARQLPVTIVSIDQASLLALGQWPWPRTTLARLLQAVQSSQPAAIGLDMLLPEVDAMSPDQIANQAAQIDPALSALLKALPANDSVLARTLQTVPTVLAFAGLPEATANSPLRAAPVTVTRKQKGTFGAPDVADYAGALNSIDALNAQAAGWGLVSVDVSRGVVRHMPLVASVNGTLVPAFAVELLRVADRSPVVRLHASGTEVRSVSVGTLKMRTDPDGSVRPYFSAHVPERFVSAIDVLQGKVDASLLRNQIVIIGPTAIALHDEQETPVGQRMSGAEIHAQLIENLLQGNALHRPRWAALAEAAMLLCFGAWLVWVTPRWRPSRVALLTLALVVLPLGGGALLFVTQRWLFDTATPGLSLLALFLGLLMLTLTESMRQRGRLERVVQAQRVESARVAGEMAAAQRIQMGTLPKVELLQGDPRVDLHATLTPAREVGGDLYDFFMLDPHRLFVLIGDVAGKGLSASIFMTVSKALYKGAMLRSPGADIGDIMAAANAEVSRDNAEQLYVTVFAAILDLHSGELRYCNAGHDNPVVLPPSGQPLRRISDGDGPPLCVMDDFPYASACCQLQPGDTLCLMTDGVSEAQNPAHELYGPERVTTVLEAWRAKAGGARELVEALQSDVGRFAAGAEPADDLTILALRWNGPAAPLQPVQPALPQDRSA